MRIQVVPAVYKQWKASKTYQYPIRKPVDSSPEKTAKFQNFSRSRFGTWSLKSFLDTDTVENPDGNPVFHSLAQSVLSGAYAYISQLDFTPTFWSVSGMGLGEREKKQSVLFQRVEKHRMKYIRKSRAA